MANSIPHLAAHTDTIIPAIIPRIEGPDIALKICAKHEIIPHFAALDPKEHARDTFAPIIAPNLAQIRTTPTYAEAIIAPRDVRKQAYKQYEAHLVSAPTHKLQYLDFIALTQWRLTPPIFAHHLGILR